MAEARTLREAILMHESLGSEANPVIDTFKSLTCDDQAAIVEFLLSLRLPVDCRYEPCFDKAADCCPAPLPQPRPASPPTDATFGGLRRHKMGKLLKRAHVISASDRRSRPKDPGVEQETFGSGKPTHLRLGPAPAADL